MNVLFLGLLSTLTLTIVTMAELTNHTLDDFDPTVLYLSGAAEGYKSTLESFFDTSSLVQRTQTMVIRPSDNIDPPGSMTFNFTGSALYVFFASPGFFEVSDFNALPAQQWEFSLDGVSVQGVTALRTPISLYNLLVYANPGIRAGHHTFRVQTVAEGWFHFDYAIYTSDDGPDPRPSQSGDGINPEPNAKGHVSISTPAIAGIAVGGVVGGVVLVCILALIFVWCRRRSKSKSRRSGLHPADEKILASPMTPPLESMPQSPIARNHSSWAEASAPEEIVAIHQRQPDIGNFVSLPGRPLHTMHGHVQPLVQQHEDPSTTGWPSMVANPPASIHETGLESSQGGYDPFALTSQGSSSPQSAWNPSTSPSEVLTIQARGQNYGPENVFTHTGQGL
ncbi:hypothetical protein C8J57DRAFT_1333213 [Mycena rebaudengoi]|nr:hypothetical protein C8J57DRAFT_1333213 [Mycena rebaudengoi]